MIDTSGYRQCVARLERASDLAFEDHLDILLLDRGAPYTSVGDRVTPGGGGCLVDTPVETGSTVAIADNTAPGLVSVPIAKQ